ncbi:MAG: hypothetical protein CL610_15950 [Anaerolineaceae bacterium]|nr:hypothetical protein [Anaerolineaceae bacterium]
MYDLHNEMCTFYDRHVRLGDTEKKKLRGYRDANIDRLETGLKKLGYKVPICTVGQGSYSMHTMVQHPDNDYDIDNAVVFDKDDLPSAPLDARKRVLAGVKEGGGNFKQPPEARTNAVTVWYAGGYHIDLPVYRRFFDMFGNEIIEHAGCEWTRRDPAEINDWFKEQVAAQSPSPDNGASVEKGQMRRIVQLLKMFARSRASWALPGGLLISVLVSERYQSDCDRDDVALYNTMTAIRSRLQWNTEILNPVDLSLKLTDTTEHVNEVIRFKEKLGKALDWLEPVMKHDCEELDAYKSWNQVFQHDYWSELVSGVEMQQAAKYVSSTGTLYLGSSADTSIQSPSHRFYGD